MRLKRKKAVNDAYYSIKKLFTSCLAAVNNE